MWHLESPSEEYMWNTYGGYHTVLRMAMTCQAFKEPALDILWHNLITLVPLIQTLPQDAWCKSDTLNTYGEKQCIITVMRPLVSTDWDRFLYYSPRIRRLGFRDIEFRDQEFEMLLQSCAIPPDCAIDAHCYTSLSLYRPVKVLLPNLGALRWNIHQIDALQFVSLFFGPSLKSFSLALSHNSRANLDPSLYSPIVSTLTSLLDICPSLLEFEMYGMEPKCIVDAIHAIALTRPNLRKFVVHYQAWTDDFISHLCRMPRLCNVAIEKPDATDFGFLTIPDHYPPFMHLTKLSLRLQSMVSCIHLLDLMRAFKLEEIWMHAFIPATAAEILQFLETLRDRCSHSSLRVVRLPGVEFSKWPKELDERHTVTSETLEPLLCFSNMRIIQIQSPSSFEVDNLALERMARAWPQLYILMLQISWVESIEVTFKGLARLVTLCPKLTRLSIAINAESDDLDSDALAALVPNSHMRKLDLMNSTFGKMDMVASCLVTLFPRLDRVDGCRGGLIEDGGRSMDSYTYYLQLGMACLNARLERKTDRMDVRRGLYPRRAVNELNPWASGP
ncbi:hypothetical protein SCP_0306210 [Sparassis crispa]|uniref:F-box domain-containing protein n=1 Tax=Sparassis crispa TaxID=139825 RepID=A0A401GFF3_9APHY|nr:hypothetical protein SCP_0306210 [Sparassis crispa]GBE80900.1 hypothetical protein SCP_0306210 [Sparassis crispa]